MKERLLYIGKLSSSRKTLEYLSQTNYETMRIEGLRPSLRALSLYEPHVVVLDMNDSSSINMRRITHTAGRRPTRPFVILLCDNRSSNLDDMVYDIVLIRPITPRRLENEMRKLLDRRRDYVVHAGPIILDRRTFHVRTPKGLTRLTPKQFLLLNYLITHAGEIVTRKELMHEVWETSYLGDTRTLDVHIRWLREHLEEDPSNPEYIRTHRGQGYSLEIEGPIEVGGNPITI